MSDPGNLRNMLKRIGAMLLGGFLLAGAVPALSQESDGAGKVPMPNVSDRKGDKCIRDEAYMRRHHMDMLKHKRDLTMRKGIRTKEDSLQNCISCHANQKTNSVIGSKDNFCQSCHSYVGVKLDCFECHSSKPKATTGETLHPIVAPSAEPVGEDKQSSLSGKMRWQMQANLASLNKGEGVK